MVLVWLTSQNLLEISLCNYYPEVNEAGDLCAICQEKKLVPVLLCCKHIFCEDCASECRQERGQIDGDALPVLPTNEKDNSRENNVDKINVLQPRIFILLRRCLYDSDDEYNDIKALKSFYLSLIESLRLQQNGSLVIR